MQRFNEHICGIVLAGGESRRMGQDKGQMKFRGRRMIEYVIDVFRMLDIPVLISANADIYNDLDYPVVADLFPDSGPMGGIYSCMNFRKSPYYAVIASDTPFINSSLYTYLFKKAYGKQIIIPDKGNGMYEPLAGLYHHSVFKVFESYIKQQNYRIPDVFEYTDFMPVPVNESLPFYTPCFFSNINSREDFIRYEKLNMQCRDSS